MRSLVAHCPASPRCHSALLVRLSFVLANLTATSPSSRAAVAPSIQHLLRLLDFQTAHLIDAIHASAAHGSDAPEARSTAEDGLETIIAPGVAEEVPNRTSFGESGGYKSRRASGAGSGGDKGPQGVAVVGLSVMEHADVLIKLIRLIAHLAMGPDEGAIIARAPESACLLRLLSTLPLEPDDIGDASAICIEELQLNALSAVTNLTFYTADGRSVLLYDPEDAGGDEQATDADAASRFPGSYGQRGGAPRRALCGILSQALTHPNDEAAAEAARALGNISRIPRARVMLCELLADEALLYLLEHPSAQVSGGRLGRGATGNKGRACSWSPPRGSKLCIHFDCLQRTGMPLTRRCCRLGASNGACVKLVYIMGGACVELVYIEGGVCSSQWASVSFRHESI